MAYKHWRLISYDIRDDTRLRKVAKGLRGYGTRLQYSVFRCYLSDRDLERLKWELAKVLTKEDDLLVVSLCENCVAKIRCTSEKKWNEDRHSFIII